VHSDAPIVSGPHREPDLAIDCHRQDESIVVIGVIADEIHSTGRTDQERGIAIEAAPEFLEEARAQLVAHGRICFIDTDNYPMESLKLTIEGMSCEHCVRAVKNRLTATPGVAVEEVEIGSAKLRYDPARTNVDEIEEVIADEGYTAFVAD